MPTPQDTIVAPATPPGRGGIGIVRVSGPATRAIAIAMLGSVPAPRHATVAIFTDAGGGAIDAGLALFFPAPHSFTGEDVLELHGHGGPVVMDLLVARAIELGGNGRGSRENRVITLPLPVPLSTLRDVLSDAARSLVTPREAPLP